VLVSGGEERDCQASEADQEEVRLQRHFDSRNLDGTSSNVLAVLIVVECFTAVVHVVQ
jgi:hypothetical protein